MGISIKELRELCGQSPDFKPIDIMEFISNMMARVMLMCALGENVTDDLVDYYEGGRVTQKTLGFSLRSTF